MSFVVIVPAATITDIRTSQGRELFIIRKWSAWQEEVSVPAGAADLALPDVAITEIPAGATLLAVFANFKWGAIENTNAGANKLSGAQYLQVRDNAPGAWANCLGFIDDLFGLAASTREGGDVAMGNINVVTTVVGNGTYNFQWHDAVADLASINFNNVQTGLEIWYTI